MKTNNILFKNRKGFTLLELIVVIAIISILAVIALPSFTSALKKARDSRKVADLRTVQSEISAYTALVSSSYYPDGLGTSTAFGNGILATAINSNNQFIISGATTTLAAIYLAGGKPVPAAVKNGDIGYAVYGCNSATFSSTTQPTATGVGYGGSCTNYAVFTKLEDASSTILTTNPASIISVTASGVLVFTN